MKCSYEIEGTTLHVKVLTPEVLKRGKKYGGNRKILLKFFNKLGDGVRQAVKTLHDRSEKKGL